MPTVRRGSSNRKVAAAGVFSLLAAGAFTSHAHAGEARQLVPAEAPPVDGYAVALSGDTAVIGGLDAPPSQLQAVYVFVRSGGDWHEEAKLVDPGDGHDNFGHAVALSGDTLVVGAATTDAIYVFVRSAGAWSLEATLHPPRAHFQDLGYAVAVSGDTLVAGAPFLACCHTSGSAWVFVRRDHRWQRQAVLRPEAEGDNDYFGSSVAIDHDTVIVGAPNNRFAEIFSRGTDGLWRRAAHLTGGGADFGSGVGVSGATVVVGGVEGAEVHVHTRGGWRLQQALLPRDRPPGAQFGQTAAIASDAIVVGAPEATVTGIDQAGAAYFFRRIQGIWRQTDRLVDPSAAGTERFGSAVAVSGSTALIGTTWFTKPGAWLFDEPPPSAAAP
jgi:hypothetical protein